MGWLCYLCCVFSWEQPRKSSVSAWPLLWIPKLTGGNERTTTLNSSCFLEGRSEWHTSRAVTMAASKIVSLWLVWTACLCPSPSPVICWSSDHHYDGTRRSGLWEAIRFIWGHGGVAPMMGSVCLFKKRKRPELVLSVMWEYKKVAVCKRKRALTGHWSVWHPDWSWASQSPELLRNKFPLFKPPSQWYVVIATWTKTVRISHFHEGERQRQGKKISSISDQLGATGQVYWEAVLWVCLLVSTCSSPCYVDLFVFSLMFRLSSHPEILSTFSLPFLPLAMGQSCEGWWPYSSFSFCKGVFLKLGYTLESPGDLQKMSRAQGMPQVK